MSSPGRTGRPGLGVADGTKPARRALAEAVGAHTGGFYGKDLAEFCGGSPSMISRFLNGRTLPPWSTVARIHTYVLLHGTNGEPPAREEWYRLYLAAAQEDGRDEVEPETVPERRVRVKGPGGVYRWVTRSQAARTGVLRASAVLGLADLVWFAVRVLALVLWEGARAFAGLWGWAALSVLIATEYWTLRRACRMQGWHWGRKERQRFNWRTLVRRRRKPSSPSSPRPNDVPPEP